MLLHALPDVFLLHANADTDRDDSLTTQTITVYLTDVYGNRLTDTAGNYLVGSITESVYSQFLHALPDIFLLHADQQALDFHALPDVSVLHG